MPVALLLASIAIAGCALLRPPKAIVSVAAVEAAFPTIEGLAAVYYMRNASGRDEPDCVFFQYSRGAFTSKPEDEFCGVFEEAARPVPVPFDDQAVADLAELKGAFQGAGGPLDYLNVNFTVTGSVGPDSTFSFDRCVGYWYDPGFPALPEDRPGDQLSTAINRDWYKTDFCP